MSASLHRHVFYEYEYSIPVSVSIQDIVMGASLVLWTGKPNYFICTSINIINWCIIASHHDTYAVAPAKHYDSVPFTASSGTHSAKHSPHQLHF